MLHRSGVGSKCATRNKTGQPQHQRRGGDARPDPHKEFPAGRGRPAQAQVGQRASLKDANRDGIGYRCRSEGRKGGSHQHPQREQQDTQRQQCQPAQQRKQADPQNQPDDVGLVSRHLSRVSRSSGSGHEAVRMLDQQQKTSRQAKRANAPHPAIARQPPGPQEEQPKEQRGTEPVAPPWPYRPEN